MRNIMRNVEFKVMEIDLASEYYITAADTEMGRLFYDDEERSTMWVARANRDEN